MRIKRAPYLCLLVSAWVNVVYPECSQTCVKSVYGGSGAWYSRCKVSVASNTPIRGITLITGGKRAKRVPPPELTIHTYRPCLSEVVLCVAIALHRGIHVSRVCFCNLITDVCVETNRHTGLSAASRTYEAEKKRIIKLQKKSYNLYRCRLYVTQ